MSLPGTQLTRGRRTGFMAVSAAAISILLFSGCRRQEGPTAGVTSPPPAIPEQSLTEKMMRAKDATEVLAVQAREALGQKWEDFKAATYEQRSDLRAHLAQASTRLDAQADAMAPKLESAQSETKAAYRSAIAKLEAARAALSAKLDHLSDATAETWTQAKKETCDAWDRVEEAYQEVERTAKI